MFCARYSGAEGEVTQQELDLLVILELTKGRGCDSELSSASVQLGDVDLQRLDLSALLVQWSESIGSLPGVVVGEAWLLGG